MIVPFRKTKQPITRKATFNQQQEKAGILVTKELEQALKDCKSQVESISSSCRAANRKFRDIEFDLENDKFRCLHGLKPNDEAYSPSDVRRVTQIFDNPQFFIDGASSNDVQQGAIGDCWFVSALATMATSEGLVEKFCVARDEKIGVYGFIFFRDTAWVTVIIDDLLYTSMPKYEELSSAEKQLYHNDREKYNESARKGSKSLYFARSATQGETWVPLLEKAYAKLHGSYAAICGGYECEAIEDLTGGVSSATLTNDIFDVDRFWNEELLKANNGRLFGCYPGILDSTRSGDPDAKINGLITSHAYSVLKAVEVRGKSFVVVRNPWGHSEWTGPWSDGSKDWTKEWLDILPVLGHTFGNDGQFIMEYKDFLECFQTIDRTLIFDSSWVMSSQWLQVQTRPFPSAWSFGDVSFSFFLEHPTTAVIVLSQLDDRYFRMISGRFWWSFDFLLYKKGVKVSLASSSYSRFFSRSVSLEIELEAGDYVVHLRLDRTAQHEKDYLKKAIKGWDERTLSRVLTERAKSRSVAINANQESLVSDLPVSLDLVAGKEILEVKEFVSPEEQGKRSEDFKRPKKKKAKTKSSGRKGKKDKKKSPRSGDEAYDELHDSDFAPDSESDRESAEAKEDAEDDSDSEDEDDDEDDPEDDIVFLGLRVYTKKDAPATIVGQLRYELKAFSGSETKNEADVSE